MYYLERTLKVLLSNRFGNNDEKIGKWNDLNCTYELGFVCRVRASTDNPDPPPKPKCQDIYSDYDQWMNGCYKTNEEAKTWQEAEQSCGSLGGGHLASILTQAEQGKA